MTPTRDIKELLKEFGSDQFIHNWLNQKSIMFNNRTPQDLINKGQAEVVLKKLRGLICTKSDVTQDTH